MRVLPLLAAFALAVMVALSAAAAPADQSMVDLGTLGGDHSGAVALNSSGQVVGDSYTSDGDWHAFAWTQKGGMSDLGNLGDDRYVAPWDINDNGQIVGESWTTNASHAFLYMRAP